MKPADSTSAITGRAINPPADPFVIEARRSFLASGDDAILPIVDAHHHFWDVQNNPHPWLTETPRIPFRYGDYESICRNFLPADYAAACGTHLVLRHVVMEGEWTPDDPVGEALWMHALAGRSGKPHAMAAQIWLDRADVGEVLQAYCQAPLSGFVRSVRHKPHCTTRAQHRGNWCEPGSMRCPRWRDGYSRLAAAGLMFELQGPWWHMGEAAELAQDFPATRLIINHAGLPNSRDADTLASWRASMQRVAPQRNVFVKVSGLGVRDHAWTPEQQEPVLRALLADFGVDRCLFASNHPVDGIVIGLADLWSGFKTLTRELAAEQRLKLFFDNAFELYDLR